MNRWISCSLMLTWLVTVAPLVWADESDAVREINELLKATKLKAAETALTAAIEQHPESDALQRLHYQFYVGYMRMRELRPAAEHLDQFLTHQLKSPQTNAPTIPRYVSILNSVYRRAGQPKQAAAVLTRVLQTLEQQPDDKRISQAITQLKAQQILGLVTEGEIEAAQKLLDQEMKARRQQLAENSESATAALQVLQLMQTQVSVHTAAGGDKLADSSAALVEFATQLAEKHANHPEALLAYINVQGQAISRLSRRDPLQAEAQLKQVQKLLGGVAGDDPEVGRVLATGKRMLASVTRRVAAAKLHLELIGKPAAPLDATAWVNGPALNDKDLEGKVVLLDFWAVWCGPCIATFPHLREWQEKYADKGLVIIGVTRYYNYEWNDQTSKARRAQSKVSAGDEQAMLAKFAEVHKLQHRFMVTPSASTFQRQFGVSGIPQAVVLDQDGTIQLIRVGSGEQNAQDIEKKIQQLLAESKAAGD